MERMLDVGMYARIGSIAVATVLAGCGDDAQSSGASGDTGDTDSTSSSSSSAPTGATSPDTEGDPDTSSSTGADTGDGADTTGGEWTDDLRVLYEVPVGETLRIEVLDVVDGVPGEATPIYELDQGDHFFYQPGNRWLFLSQRQPFFGVAFDLSTPPPFTSWNISDMLPAELGSLAAYDASGSHWVLDISDTVESDFYALEMSDAGPSTPFHVDAGIPETVGVLRGAFTQDDERFVFSARDLVNHTGSLWTGPLAPTDPAPETVLEFPAMNEEISSLYEDPSGRFLVYVVGGGSSDHIVHLIDLTHGLVDEGLTIGAIEPGFGTPHLRFAPDASGVAALQCDGTIYTPGEIVWAAIVDGVPQPPVALTTGLLAGHGYDKVLWSSDARWIAFGTRDPHGVHVVRIDDDGPGETITLSDDPIETFAFAPDASYLYFTATTPAGAVVLQRVALGGDEPGAPEVLSAEYPEIESFALAEDGSALVYLAHEADGTSRHVYWIDISSSDAAPALRMDADADSFPTSVQISRTGRHIVYRRQHPTEGYAAVLVDTETTVETPLADGAAIQEVRLLGIE